MVGAEMAEEGVELEVAVAGGGGRGSTASEHSEESADDDDETGGMGVVEDDVGKYTRRMTGCTVTRN